ncbi:MAG: hypothetical protein PQ612_08355 [Rickettsiales bacterium]|nr:hypothetical protein [Pseudomonadota bacterium]MDA0966767.1 hypothetical protein [Pseudomonadota bacterium]MDG4543439.1 hypothetical protein [Rickettsiales bacterium]MDG4546167.1 hypothetical protein [Rickettsiales bacterium]MDG4547640.1 hypothetical protein [Rickettsiales bacterium]
MKNRIPIENRLARAKSFKTDNVIKSSQILKKLEMLHQHFKKLSNEQIDDMWPNVDYRGANDNSKGSIIKNSRIRNKEFLITLLARATQTVNAVKFAREKADLDLQDKQINDVIKQKSEEIGRNF